jgi:hypothetical protein
VTRTFLSPEAAGYLEALRAEFADLPPEERDDLLADVETSLIEAADEGEGSIAARLGSPADFAQELRAAAGIQAAVPPAAAARTRGSLERISAAVERLLEHPRVAAARRPLGELAPIWWLARAYVAGGALALVAGIAWSIGHPELPRFTNATVTVLVFAGLAAGSLWLGIRTRGATRGRRVLTAVNLVLAIAAIPVAAHVLGTRAPVQEVVVSLPTEPPAGLTYNGVAVQNLYPYGRDGRLLQDVLLYDGYGQPVNVGGTVPDPDRRVLVTAGGDRIFNSFPIRYFEPQTTEVAHPYAGPPVQLPHVLTPRLQPVKSSR